MWFYIFVVLFAHHIATQISPGPSPSTMVCQGGWNGTIGEEVSDLQKLLPRLLGPLHAEGDLKEIIIIIIFVDVFIVVFRIYLNGQNLNNLIMI